MLVQAIAEVKANKGLDIALAEDPTHWTLKVLSRVGKGWVKSPEGGRISRRCAGQNLPFSLGAIFQHAVTQGMKQERGEMHS